MLSIIKLQRFVLCQKNINNGYLLTDLMFACVLVHILLPVIYLHLLTLKQLANKCFLLQEHLYLTFSYINQPVLYNVNNWDIVTNSLYEKTVYYKTILTTTIAWVGL